MAIEIKELHIRVAVNTASAGPSPSGPAPRSDGSTRQQDDGAKDALVAECVEQVLQILQNKAER